MPRLVDQHLSGARQLEAGRGSGPEIFGGAGGLRGLEFRHGRLDVVAHQRHLVLQRVRVVVAFVRARCRMHTELARAALEDQPAWCGLDVGPAEHVAEERPRGLRVVRVDERVKGREHARESTRTSPLPFRRCSSKWAKRLRRGYRSRSSAAVSSGGRKRANVRCAFSGSACADSYLARSLLWFVQANRSTDSSRTRGTCP